jgi:hypothetical protein
MADATNPPIDELYPIAVLIDELKVWMDGGDNERALDPPPFRGLPMINLV